MKNVLSPKNFYFFSIFSKFSIFSLFFFDFGLKTVNEQKKETKVENRTKSKHKILKLSKNFFFGISEFVVFLIVYRQK